MDYFSPLLSILGNMYTCTDNNIKGTVAELASDNVLAFNL